MTLVAPFADRLFDLFEGLSLVSFQGVCVSAHQDVQCLESSSQTAVRGVREDEGIHHLALWKSIKGIQPPGEGARGGIEAAVPARPTIRLRSLGESSEDGCRAFQRRLQGECESAIEEVSYVFVAHRVRGMRMMSDQIWTTQSSSSGRSSFTRTDMSRVMALSGVRFSTGIRRTGMCEGWCVDMG